MRERWIEEIRTRTAARWPEERIRRELGDKQRMLPLVEAAPLLRALNLLDGRGELSRDTRRKYLQIDHMAQLLEVTIKELMREHPVVRILDVACGSSYLTATLAWCFTHRWRHPCRILGVDRNPDVIERSRERAKLARLDDCLRFATASIAELDTAASWREAFDEPLGQGDVNALFALHACDTATDEALALGVELAAQVIAVAPCCQSELARAWATLADGATRGALAPIWASPHLRREAAATMTDALRASLLGTAGYRVTAMAFVPAEHTPKNTMLRARRGDVDAGRARAEYRELKRSLGGAAIRLETLLAR
jgi:SAM-dependent methyltransferase